MSDALPPAPNHLVQFLGFAFLVGGVLWMAFSGLCALGVLATVVTEGFDINGFLTVVTISGVSFAAGFGIFAIGRAMVWPKSYVPAPVPPADEHRPPS